MYYKYYLIKDSKTILSTFELQEVIDFLEEKDIYINDVDELLNQEILKDFKFEVEKIEELEFYKNY